MIGNSMEIMEVVPTSKGQFIMWGMIFVGIYYGFQKVKEWF